MQKNNSVGQILRRSVLFLAVTLLVFYQPVCAENAKLDSDEIAERILEQAGSDTRIVAVLCDEEVAFKIAQSKQYLVHARSPETESIIQLRKRADSDGLGIHQLVAEYGALNPLPYGANVVDMVCALSARALPEIAIRDVLRVLRPRGIAILGSNNDRKNTETTSLLQQAKTAGAINIQTLPDGWIRFQKPTPNNIGDWTHWENGPDNNPVSNDQVIKAPYMTQFLSKPYYIGMPAITTAAGGRTFLAIGHIAHHRREWEMLNKIIARNGYNGAKLWERKLPEGYLVHRSAFIATDETFYRIDQDGCLMLDAKTGDVKGRIRIPGDPIGDWKWMAMKDGRLYVLAGKPGPGTETTKGDRSFGGWSWADLSKGYYGKRIPHGFGDKLVCYDMDSKSLIWSHQEETLIDSRGLAIRDGRMYLYCPDRHLRGLSTKTGDVVWTNNDPQVMELIEQPGRGLRSTPGFRTACMTVATTDALIIQGQTRMNVIAISTSNGDLLWKKKKFTNNPNAIFVDGNVILGVGTRGSHVVMDPVTGEEKEDLGFVKTACTRLTASSDSFFVRGEGTLRFDRASKKLLIDGGQRPACNDGALPANGILYIGPWQCDCNLSLIGCVAKCSAGDFRFDRLATEKGRLHVSVEDTNDVATLDVSPNDWATYRANNQRSAGTDVAIPDSIQPLWQYDGTSSFTPNSPTAAGDLVFLAGDDGKVRAIDAMDGSPRWKFLTPAPIQYPPTIWAGRLFFGSSDGHVYCLEATSGRLLWRFRAAPVERHIMVYDYLRSTWPVASGVLVEDGVAYFAAGIIDQDGTYVFALDAKSGKIKWQNHSSGHLNPELRKGVSVQGNLSIAKDRLLLAGGNQVSPAAFDMHSGNCLANSFAQGRPKANNGKFVGAMNDKTQIIGGRVLYSAPENVATKGSFAAVSGGRAVRLAFGGIPPAWRDSDLVLVNYRFGKVTCCDTELLAKLMQTGLPRPSDRPGRRIATLAGSMERDQSMRWHSDLGETNRFEAVSLAVCSNAVVAVVKQQPRFRAHPEWSLVAYGLQDGKVLFRQPLEEAALPDGLMIDRRGQIFVTMLDGSIVCFGKQS